MAVTKKGMFFTLISIVIIVALIAFFRPNTEYLLQATSIPTTRVRVNKANHMMGNFKTTLVERELKASSYFAIQQLLDCMEYIL